MDFTALLFRQNRAADRPPRRRHIGRVFEGHGTAPVGEES
jgi:hypothetical protein